MRVIGIDPGTAIVGYGIVDYEKGKYNLIDYGCINTDKNLPMEDRLLIIYNDLKKILEKYSPNEMAVEDLFYFKNNKTVISVGQARGVILLAGKEKNIILNNYTPLQVKIGISGYGRATKNQVQQMVKTILNLEEIPKPDDAADAIAIAITHINTLLSGIPNQTKAIPKKIKNISNKITAEEYKKLFVK